MSYDLTLSQIQMRTFVMVDGALGEVSGLGAAFTLQISKAGGAFNASTGTKAEIGNGWYRYTFTAAETDTAGPLSVRVTGVGCLQQNLEYIVRTAAITAIAFTYTVTDPLAVPIEGVQVWISTDVAGTNVIWSGDTDAFGVARDGDGNLPFLDPGTYQFWSQKVGYTFTNPDAEVVS